MNEQILLEQIDTLKEQLDVAVAAVEGLEGTLAATRSAASAQETELHQQIKDLQARPASRRTVVPSGTT